LQAVDALQTNWGPHLGRIISPTLAVWGEHDGITPVALGCDIAETPVYEQLIVLPNAEHNPMWERVEAINAEVLRFLAEASDTGR
jgi:pimeloyl-ACP methyl ester carboxylesterase